MIVKLLTEHHLEFLSLKRGSWVSTFVKMSNCWKSHAATHIELLTHKIMCDSKIQLLAKTFEE